MTVQVTPVACLAVLAACGGEPSVTPDAYDGPCWPLPSTPGGEVELGTGALRFEPMPDIVPIKVNERQGDPFIEVHSRIRGIPGGDPYNAFDPTNPRTKVAAVIDELGWTLPVAVDCPATRGYFASSEPGAFDLPQSLTIGFETFERAREASGKPVRITLEVVGSNGLYAKAEKEAVLGDVPPRGKLDPNP
jgi:hypothetical protein